MNCSDSFSLCSNLFLVGGLVVFSSPMLGSWNGGRLRVGMGILYVCSSAEDQATGMQLVGGLLEGLLHGRPAKRLCGLPSFSLSSYTTVHALNTSHTMTTCLLLRELILFFLPFFVVQKSGLFHLNGSPINQGLMRFGICTIKVKRL